MKTPQFSLATRILLVSVPLLFLGLFSTLAAIFDYPQILRHPAAEVLTRFQAGGPGLVALWYGLAASALLLIPASVLAARDLGGSRFVLVFGVVAGLVQGIGFLRWSFAVPELARLWTDPSATEAVRGAVLVVFDTLNRLVGQGIGEHLGYLATAGWTAALVLAPENQGPGRWWWAGAGMVLAAGIVYGVAEPLGAPAAGLVNALAYTLWALWLPAFVALARKA